MEIDQAQFSEILAVVFQAQDAATVHVPAEDVVAIVGIGQLVAGADKRDDADERSALDELTEHLCKLAKITPANIPALASPLPGDLDERLDRMGKLGEKLTSMQAKELAYAVAYVVSISDLDLAPEEAEMIDDLAVALGISDERSDELAAAAASAVTPPG
jgi:tellurite resistance protein